MLTKSHFAVKQAAVKSTFYDAEQMISVAKIENVDLTV